MTVDPKPGDTPLSIDALQAAYDKQLIVLQWQAPEASCFRREVQFRNAPRLDEAFALIYATLPENAIEVTPENWHTFIDLPSENEIRSKVAVIMNLPLPRQRKLQQLLSVLDDGIVKEAGKSAMLRTHCDKRFHEISSGRITGKDADVQFNQARKAHDWASTAHGRLYALS